MKALRIAITADPYIPVPPLFYGGIERVVDFLARGLVSRGHQVTLFAHPDSLTAGVLVPYGVPPHFGWKPRLAELWQVGSVLWHRRREFDLVLSFGRLKALSPILPLRRLPKIQRYCRTNQVPWRGVKRAVRLAGESIRFLGASTSVYRARSTQGIYGGRWNTIFDGVEIAKYNFIPAVSASAPLVFLGRLEPMKGAHTAIAIAKSAGKRLLIAGNQVLTGPDADYFDRQIAPSIDGDQVSYLGPVDDAQKNALLGSALALLFPTQYEEAFGIVMAEAMACGTPVIGLARGSVSEVVRDGLTGYVCRSVDEAVTAVAQLDRINRATVRADCEGRFSNIVIVGAYEQLFREVSER